jgi:hypothetical protein
METRKLQAVDRPREFYRYEVQGIGGFPIDMLRYDSAWPTDSESASRMVTSRAHAEGRRTIRLASYHRPTVDRWSSFGWTVLD